MAFTDKKQFEKQINEVVGLILTSLKLGDKIKPEILTALILNWIDTFRWRGDALGYAKIEEKLILLKKERMASLSDMTVANISSIRNFMLTLATVSITVSGAVISVLASDNKTSLFRFAVCNIPLVYVGLVLLVLCIIVAIIRLAYILVLENDLLAQSYNIHNRVFTNIQNQLEKNLKDKKPLNGFLDEQKISISQDKESAEFESKQEKRLNQRDYYPYIVSGLFLVGLLMIALSLIKI